MSFKPLTARYTYTASAGLLSVLLCMFSYAYEKPDLQKIYKESQEAARTLEPKLQELAKGRGDIGNIKDALNQGTANHQTVDLNNLPSLGEKAKENDVEKPECTKSSCNVASSMSAKAMRNREVKLEEYGFTKDMEQFYKDDKGYIDKARHNARKFEKSYDSISGLYKDCTQKDQSYSYHETNQCDEYYDVKHSNCPISQIVEIDPYYTYECNKKRPESIKTCHDEIVSITCQKSSECDNGGIIASSVQSDMKWVYNFPILTLGTISDNYWKGRCAVFDRTTKFKVKNLSKITEFRIVEVGFDDYLWIKINGNTVYVGPDGGDQINVRRDRYVTYDGKKMWRCERNHNWRIPVNIDLKPYLKEGENDIWMRVIVAGAGEGWMKISAKQYCCKNEDWVVQRDTTCKREEM